MTKAKEELTNNELKNVTGGNNFSISQGNNDFGDGGIKDENVFKGIGCQYNDGTDAFGGTFPVCSDWPNKGLKPECASCPARNK